MCVLQDKKDSDMNAKYKKSLERFLELEKMVENVSRMENVRPCIRNTFNLRELNMHLFENKPPILAKN